MPALGRVDPHLQVPGNYSSAISTRPERNAASATLATLVFGGPGFPKFLGQHGMLPAKTSFSGPFVETYLCSEMSEL